MPLLRQLYQKSMMASREVQATTRLLLKVASDQLCPPDNPWLRQTSNEGPPNLRSSNAFVHLAHAGTFEPFCNIPNTKHIGLPHTVPGLLLQGLGLGGLRRPSRAPFGCGPSLPSHIQDTGQEHTPSMPIVSLCVHAEYARGISAIDTIDSTSAFPKKLTPVNCVTDINSSSGPIIRKCTRLS